MEQTAPRVRESPVRPQKTGQARCADAISADLLRSSRVLQRSKNPFDSPMAGWIAMKNLSQMSAGGGVARVP